MKTLLLLSFISLFLFSSCEETEKKKVPINNSSKLEALAAKMLKEEFEAYLKHFKPAKLPLVFNSNDEIKLKGPDLNGDDYPSFIEGWQQAPYGFVKLKDGKIALIIIYSADERLLAIHTYTKEGKSIDNKQISIGRCGPDACFNCEEISIVNSDLTTNCKHTSIYTDCNGNNSVTSYTEISQSGKVLQDGRIKLNKKMEKQIVKPRKPTVDTTNRPMTIISH